MEESIVTKDSEEKVLGETVSEETRDEAEVVTINVEPIILVSDEEESKGDAKRARRRKWRASAPKNKVCDQCQKAFKTNAEVTRHKRSHTGEKPFMCTDCGNSYSQLSHLQMHTLKHHNHGFSPLKNIQCEECSSTFFRKSELDRHMKTHTGEKPFKCEICAKRFTQKNNLVMHVKVHANDRPHQCTECGKRFIARSKLLRHMQKHTMQKKKSLMHMGEMFGAHYDDEQI